MAGNFWKSSHCQQWLLDPQELMMTRMKDLQAYNIKEDEYYKLMIFFANFIQAHGEQLKLRQQVITSAIVYFKRFYSKYSLKCIDPFLLAPTCLLLATKVEEFGLQQQQRYQHYAASLLKNKYSHLYPQEYPYGRNDISECEFYLLEVMDCCLILYHPYRSLCQYWSDLAPEDSSLLQIAWRIVNDSYRTDACLLYPPSLISLACLQMIFEITRHILNLYEIWKQYDEKDQMKEILNKIPKPRTEQRPSSQPSEQQINSQKMQQQQQQQQQQSQHQHQNTTS